MAQMFPIRFSHPLNNVINREVQFFGSLLNVIRETVSEIASTALG